MTREKIRWSFLIQESSFKNKIGTSVWDVTFHEMRKINEIMKWKKNRRDVRQLKSIYRLIFIGQTIDERLSIYIMTTSFCGRFDKEVYDIGRRYCSLTDVSTTEMKNLSQGADKKDRNYRKGMLEMSVGAGEEQEEDKSKYPMHFQRYNLVISVIRKEWACQDASET